MENKHVFISYKSSEREKALDTKTFLEQNGISCWMDENEIFIGENYANVIYSAIQNAYAIVIILSQESASSKHVQSEIALASKHSIPVLAFAIEDFDITQKYNFSFSPEERYKAFEDEDKALQQLLTQLFIIKNTTNEDPYNVRLFLSRRRKFLNNKKKNNPQKEPVQLSKSIKDIFSQYHEKVKSVNKENKRLYYNFPLNLTPYSKAYSANSYVRLSLNIQTFFLTPTCLMLGYVCYNRHFGLFPSLNALFLRLLLSASLTFLLFLLSEAVAGIISRVIGKIKSKILVFAISLLTGGTMASYLFRVVLMLSLKLGGSWYDKYL